ncbi:MAG: hypothetical protein M3441_10380 [Chloroflexota bacterium]|nr:hypothetical protein [Chloroflexota bacterium]
MAMSKVYVDGRGIPLQATQVIGTGGEADVYSIGGGLALKVYKSPDHPDLQSATAVERATLQSAARERLDTAQRKLRVFPRNLPQAVLGPLELAYDGPAQGCVVGYTMPYLAGADLLYQYGKRKFREDALQTGLSPERVRDVLLDLHGTVRAIHSAGVVIGDFNDLNVLVREGTAYLVDADSFQYGGFLCRTFQYRFVDPLICDPRLDHLELYRPHTEESDWYAYSVIALQCLLFVDPYAGLYKPQAPGKSKGKISESARPLHRITIFSPDVQCPRPAIPYQALPDDLLEYFRETFERDRRGEFPARLLQDLRWSRCPRCGTDHARPSCPWCQPRAYAQVPLVVPMQTMRGDVTASLVFETDGRILAADIRDGQLCWLYQQDGELRREDGSTVLRGGLGMGMEISLSGSVTHVAQGANLVSLMAGAPPERRVIETIVGAGTSAIPVFAANSVHLYWVEGGRLYRDSALGPYAIGNVLSHQTRIWAGERFGLGYYRAGGLEGALLFGAEHAGVNDQVGLALPPGQLLDATCLFSDERCWFLAAIKEPRGVTNHCVLLARNGRVLGRHSAPEGDGSWLGTLRGKCAAGSSLLCATDEGVVRVADFSGALVQTRLFPDTAPYVDSATQLFAGRDGLYAVGDRTIYLLRLGNAGNRVPPPGGVLATNPI